MIPKITYCEIRREKCSLIRETLEGMGFIIRKPHNSESQLIWFDGSIPLEETINIRCEQRSNKIPGMDTLCYKSNIFQALNQMQTLFPNIYTFYPKTFLLPHQYTDFLKEHIKFQGKFGRENITWIVKPKNGCCGAGIKLIQNPYDLSNDSTASVVQSYIHPFLIENHKFDFRLYLLISDLDPLHVYIYHEGIARFCSDEYHAPTKSNLNDKFMHLTNTAINVGNHSKNDFEITRAASSILNQIADMDKDGALLWDKIKSLSMLTVLALYPQIISSVMNAYSNKNKNAMSSSSSPNLSASLKHSQLIKRRQSSYSITQKPFFDPSSDPLHRSFHILGIDIMVDDKCDPVFLELNDNPSMKVGVPFENVLKKNIISDAIKVVSSLDPVTSSLTAATSTGWQKLLPIDESSPIFSVVRTIQQRALNVFGPRINCLISQQAKAIVYPKIVQDKSKLRKPVHRY